MNLAISLFFNLACIILLIYLLYLIGLVKVIVSITEETKEGRPVEVTRRNMRFQLGPVNFYIGSFVGSRWLDTDTGGRYSSWCRKNERLCDWNKVTLGDSKPNSDARRMDED